MNNYFGMVSIVVEDYDDALNFYVNVLGFDCVEDKIMSPEKRWVVVKPKSKDGGSLLLAKAKNEREHAYIGNQTGGRVFLFLYTDDFDQFYQNLIDNDVYIAREVSIEPFGKVAVFSDLYGNLWDLIGSS